MTDGMIHALFRLQHSAEEDLHRNPLRMFVELCGISKANSSVDYAMLEYCIREDLKMKRPRMMAILDPVKVVIDNYPEGETEYLEVVNNLENEELGVA